MPESCLRIFDVSEEVREKLLKGPDTALDSHKKATCEIHNQLFSRRRVALPTRLRRAILKRKPMPSFASRPPHF